MANLLNWNEMNGRLYSDGWQEGVKNTDIIEPATGKTLAQVALGSAETISKAAKIAAAAQKEWMRVPPEEKRALFIRVEALWRDYADEICEWTMQEIGATRSKAQFEINFCSDEFLEAAVVNSGYYGYTSSGNYG